MACLGIFLGDLLPAWLKRFVASPDRSYTSSPGNNSTPEGHSSPASHRISVNSRTGYMSGTIALPSPACMPTLTKPAMDDEYHMWQPFACNQTPPLRKPFAVYSSDLGIVKFLKYAGVKYCLNSPYYLCLFVRYDDSAEGYVGVPPFSFNLNTSLQQELKDLVHPSEWQDLQDRYGFGFIDPIM